MSNKVLCLCFGNTCRSPMMERVLQQAVGDAVKVESAGTASDTAGQLANEFSIKCMAERGIDLTDHKSRWIGDLDLKDYAAIVCVGDNERRYALELLQNDHTLVIVANEANGGVPNPYQKGEGAYRECLATLDRVMPDIAKTILAHQ